MRPWVKICVKTPLVGEGKAENKDQSLISTPCTKFEFDRLRSKGITKKL